MRHDRDVDLSWLIACRGLLSVTAGNPGSFSINNLLNLKKFHLASGLKIRRVRSFFPSFDDAHNLPSLMMINHETTKIFSNRRFFNKKKPVTKLQILRKKKLFSMQKGIANRHHKLKFPIFAFINNFVNANRS